MNDHIISDHYTNRTRIKKYHWDHFIECEDFVAIERPLQININDQAVSITMRTPGDDVILALGFLFTEGILSNKTTIKNVQQKDENTVNVILEKDIDMPLLATNRNFYSTSSCGVCGKTSVDQLAATSAYHILDQQLKVEKSIFFSLQEQLLKVQNTFEKTGGIHACALFDLAGNYVMHKEDVGRHNALDKLIGSYFLENTLPIQNSILLLSGRASFELIQKAAMAGIPIVAAVGAPSSFAIEHAQNSGQTLVGFLKSKSFNVYAEPSRII